MVVGPPKTLRETDGPAVVAAALTARRSLPDRPRSGRRRRRAGERRRRPIGSSRGRGPGEGPPQGRGPGRRHPDPAEPARQPGRWRPVSGHLGLFGRGEGETGELDVEELWAGLAGSPRTPIGPVHAAVDSCGGRTGEGHLARSPRLVFAVVVLVFIVAGLVAAFVLWRSMADAGPTMWDRVTPRRDPGAGRRRPGGDRQDLHRCRAGGQRRGLSATAALDADVQGLRPGHDKVRKNALVKATADALVAKGIASARSG